MSAEKAYGYLVIGAGPGGLQAGYCLQQQGRDYLIIESGGRAGTTFERFPRHRKLISINKVHTGYSDPEINLRWDWNSLLSSESTAARFTDYSQRYFPDADDMPRYLDGFAKEHQLNVRTDSSVVNVRRDQDFIVTLSTGEELRARVLIVATGVQLPWLPDIEGIEYAEHYVDMDIDPVPLTNKKVLILGKGNSGFETADALIEHAAMIHVASPNPLRMAWSTHYVGHVRAVNNNLLDTYQLKSQNAILDVELQRIERDGDKFKAYFGYQHAEGEQEVIEYDRVIACTGFRFDDSMFDESCRPELCSMGRLPAQQADWQSQNIPDLYFAGTLMQYLDYKKYMSGFIHGFRYNVRTLCQLLVERYDGVALPQVAHELMVAPACERIIERVNQSSALWQQPGFLQDVMLIDRQQQRLNWYLELPQDYITQRFAADEYMTLTLEFGQRKFDNPFNVSRIARENIKRAEDSNFLHPIIRHYRDGKLLAEHHIIEDLAAEWREAEHLEPLADFLRQQLPTAQHVPVPDEQKLWNVILTF